MGFADAATARYALDPNVDGFTSRDRAILSWGAEREEARETVVDWEGTLRPMIEGTDLPY